MVPGTSAVVAEIDEDWVTPVGVRIAELGGVVFRRPKVEVVEDQLDAESAAAAQATLHKVQGRLKAIANKIDAKSKQSVKRPTLRLAGCKTR